MTTKQMTYTDHMMINYMALYHSEDDQSNGKYISDVDQSDDDKSYADDQSNGT